MVIPISSSKVMLLCVCSSNVLLEELARAAEKRAAEKNSNNVRSLLARQARNPSQTLLDLRTLFFVVGSGLSFTALDSSEWKQLMKHCGKHAHSGDTLRRVILPAAAAVVRAHSKEQLKRIAAAALAIDGWDLSRKKIIGIVTHFVSDDWKLRTLVLGLVRATGSQTATSIAAVVTARVDAFFGKDTLISGAAADNGANYQKACETISNGEQWPCVPHTLQLAIHDALDAHGSEAKKALQSVHNIVCLVRDSAAWREALEEAQARDCVPRKKLALENDTRWHSQLAMVESFVTTFPQLKAIGVPAADNTLYSIVEELQKVLTEVRAKSRGLEADQEVTLSLVIPIIFQLRQLLTRPTPGELASTSNFKRALASAIDSRFSSVFSEVTQAGCAFLLDPRTCRCQVISEELRNSLWAALEEEALELKLGGTEGMVVGDVLLFAGL